MRGRTRAVDCQSSFPFTFTHQRFFSCTERHVFVRRRRSIQTTPRSIPTVRWFSCRALLSRSRSSAPPLLFWATRFGLLRKQKRGSGGRLTSAAAAAASSGFLGAFFLASDLFFIERAIPFGEMELLSFSCSSFPCHTTSSSQKRQSSRSLDPRHSSNLLPQNKIGVLCIGTRRKWNNHFGLQSRYRSGQPKGICCSYVADRDVNLSGVSSKGDILKKVVVPSLPGEPHGNLNSPISSVWEWKPKFNVQYEKSGMDNVNAPALLFLPGFAVGSLHYEKQLKDLGQEFRVWALDFLGQGKSLPSEDPTLKEMEGKNSEGDEMLWGFGDQTEPWAEELVFSMDLWRDQVHNFIEEVVGEPVYIVGNSLGGFVALYFAACNPDLVKGVTLLNATPFWGLLPNPTTSPRWAKLFPWSGTFPLPANVRKLTELVWGKISDPSSIHEVLKQVYADHSTKIDAVFTRIIETTQHPAAPASFASIIFAPKAQLSFNESLARCKLQDVPVCLMYGKEDPWINTVWGLKVKKQVPEAPYYEISPAGHCPHDEVPEVVNFLIRGWVKHLESKGMVSLPLIDNRECLEYDISRDVEFIREGSWKSVKVHVFGSNLSIWKQIRSFLKRRATKSVAARN